MVSCFLNVNAGLLATTLALDFCITVVENGGADVNSSVVELEVRVETLEAASTDHETRIVTAETNIEGLMKVKKK